jgi:hypothetical protein
MAHTKRLGCETGVVVENAANPEVSTAAWKREQACLLLTLG